MTCGIKNVTRRHGALTKCTANHAWKELMYVLLAWRSWVSIRKINQPSMGIVHKRVIGVERKILDSLWTTRKSGTKYGYSINIASDAALVVFVVGSVLTTSWHKMMTADLDPSLAHIASCTGYDQIPKLVGNVTTTHRIKRTMKHSYLTLPCLVRITSGVGCEKIPRRTKNKNLGQYTIFLSDECVVRRSVGKGTRTGVQLPPQHHGERGVADVQHMCG